MKEKFSFEESLKKLEEASERLKSQDTTLEDAIRNYELGLKYYKECKEILKSAHKKVKDVEVIENE